METLQRQLRLELRKEIELKRPVDKSSASKMKLMAHMEKPGKRDSIKIREHGLRVSVLDMDCFLAVRIRCVSKAG